MATEVSRRRRIPFLAQPKRLPAGFIEDRRSVYWIDTTPPRAGENGQTSITASPRLQELARHKDPHRDWKCDRPTPKWTVSEAAKRVQPSKRILALSEPKKVHPQFHYDRSPYIRATLGDRSTAATDRRYWPWKGNVKMRLPA